MLCELSVFTFSSQYSHNFLIFYCSFCSVWVQFHSATLFDVNISVFLLIIQIVTLSDCTGLKTTWNNMKADKEFPVSSGTILSLSCNVGYELKGDETVTCTTETKFQFSIEPNCGEF